MSKTSSIVTLPSFIYIVWKMIETYTDRSLPTSLRVYVLIVGTSAKNSKSSRLAKSHEFSWQSYCPSMAQKDFHSEVWIAWCNVPRWRAPKTEIRRLYQHDQICDIKNLKPWRNALPFENGSSNFKAKWYHI